MDTKEIFDFIDIERRLKFETKLKLAEATGVSKQNLKDFSNRLEKNKPNNQFNRICKILDVLGYELQIKKKGEKWIQKFYFIH